MQIGKIMTTALFCTLTAVFAAAARAPARPADDGEFPMKQAPSTPDWQTFMQANDADLIKLWTYQTKRGRHLHDWSWGWRLGWVRVCGRSEAIFCTGVLQEALLDQAVVVRAEAASALGRKYEHSANPAVVRILAEAYGNSRNLRRGKPLFVQRRLLYALHQIGGDGATLLGGTLAATDPSMVAYWQHLAQAETR